MVLRINNIVCGYGESVILNDFSCEIERGTIKGILGPNGSGKSTLLKSIMRLLEPNKGSITLDDEDISTIRHKEFAKRVAYVPQASPNTSDFTVREFVAMGRYPYSGILHANDSRQIIDDAMKIAQCERWRNRLCSNLSGGEMQRVVIAKALAQEPDYLLLDEPTANLDIVSVSNIGSMLKRIASKQNIGVLLVSHDVNFLSAISDKMMLLRDGKIFDRGKPHNILSESNLQKLFLTDSRFLLNKDSSYPQILIEY